MKRNSVKKIIFLICLLVGINSTCFCHERVLRNEISGSDQRKLIPGRTAEIFYHPKLKKVILINGAFTPGTWHTKFIELWEWKNNDWELLSDEGPETRNFFSWAYDSKRNKLVLFGGLNSPERNNRKRYSDTWEWDGKNWTEIKSSLSPGQISAAKMTYDPIRKACILFGGNNEKIQMLGDTWAFNGKEWKKIFDKGPAPRAPAAMVYFPVTKKVYLYGGHAPSTTSRGNLGDIWELGAEGWTQIQFPQSPGIRSQTEMVFNEEAKKIWLIGGSGDTAETAFLGDVWSFDGKKWEQIDIKGLPPRSSHGLSYDLHNRRIVIFGGINVGGGKRLTDTFILEGKTKEWKCVSNCS